MRASDRATRAATAYHEAGHAVAAFSSNKRLHKMSIMPDHNAGVLGYVKSTMGIGPAIEYGEPDKYPRLVTENVTILLAGVVAEREHTKGRHNWAGARSDRHQAIGLAGRILSNEELGPYMKWLMVRTRHLVSWRWSAVEALAQEMLAREEMSGRDAEALVRCTLYPPLPPADLSKWHLADAISAKSHTCIEECRDDVHVQIGDDGTPICLEAWALATRQSKEEVARPTPRLSSAARCTRRYRRWRTRSSSCYASRRHACSLAGGRSTRAEASSDLTVARCGAYACIGPPRVIPTSGNLPTPRRGASRKANGEGKPVTT